MDLKLSHSGSYLLKNFRTTNKIEEDEEVLTGYLTLEGTMPAEIFEVLTGMNSNELPYEGFFWGGDGQSNFPGMKAIPFGVEAAAHIVEFGPGIKYTDNDATVRKFKIEPTYGRQWDATFEILIHPTTDAVIGRIAARQGHDVEVKVVGPREADMFAGGEDD